MFGNKSCSPITSLAQDYCELKTPKDQKTERNFDLPPNCLKSFFLDRGPGTELSPELSVKSKGKV